MLSSIGHDTAYWSVGHSARLIFLVLMVVLVMMMMMTLVLLLVYSEYRLRTLELE